MWSCFTENKSVQISDNSGIAFGFADFPTPETLRELNIRQTSLRRLSGRRSKRPSPVTQFKDEVFILEDFREIDQHAMQVKEIQS